MHSIQLLCWTIHASVQQWPQYTNISHLSAHFTPFWAFSTTIYDIINLHLLLNRWRPISDPGQTEKSALQIYEYRFFNIFFLSRFLFNPVVILFFQPSQIWSEFLGYKQLSPSGREPSAGDSCHANTPDVTKMLLLHLNLSFLFSPAGDGLTRNALANRLCLISLHRSNSDIMLKWHKAALLHLWS